MALIIVDSDILIEASRGRSEAIDCLVRLEKTSRLAISVITQLELTVGCRDKIELRDLEKFLKRYEILRITDQISDKAVEIEEILSKPRIINSRWFNCGNCFDLRRTSHFKKPTRFSLYKRLKFIALFINLI